MKKKHSITIIFKNAASLQKNKKTFARSNAKFYIIGDVKNLTIEKTDLCIIESDFTNEEHLKSVKEFICNNGHVELWAANKVFQKKEILKAYSLGFKNFLTFQLLQDAIDKYFFELEKQKNKNTSYSKKIHYSHKIKEIFQNDSFEGMRVLIIDDNEVNTMLLEAVVSIFKVEIIRFEDPQKGLEYALNHKVDLMLLAVMMKNLNGFEIAEQVKTSFKNETTPIVFISALTNNEYKIKGFQLGAYGFIEKPFEISTLRAQLFNILKVKQLEKRRECFIETLTHDLKTPIRAQIQAMEILQKGYFGPLTQMQKEIINETLNSCKFLHFMTDDLVAQYKFEHKGIQLNKTNCSLKKLLEDSINSLKYITKQKNQSTILRYYSDIEYLLLDEIEFRRALNNLIINASEYSPKNGFILIEVKNSSKNQVIISITDSGFGIKQEDQSQIFTEYRNEAKKFKKIGAGLGLFVTKKIIEQHNGKINIKKPPNGIGTSFEILLEAEKNF